MFIGASRKGDIFILGIPYDGRSSGRPGARYAPSHIRESSELIEEYSPYLNMDLRDIGFVDLGDIEDIPHGDTAFFYIKKKLESIINGKKGIFIGGDHSISIPVVEVISRMHKNLFVIHIDAHLDLRYSYFGDRFSHASVLRRIGDIVGYERILQVCGRSGSREEYEFARRKGIIIDFKDLPTSLEEVLFRVGKNPVYITLDLDVFDPSYIPGVGVPEPFGISPMDFLSSLPILKEMNIISMDIVELNPLVDPSGSSSIIAAEIVREMLILLSCAGS